MADLSTRVGYTGGHEIPYLSADWMMDKGVVERRNQLRELSTLSRQLESATPPDIKFGMLDRESSNVEDRRIKGSMPEHWAPAMRIWDEARRRELQRAPMPLTTQIWPTLAKTLQGYAAPDLYR